MTNPSGIGKSVRRLEDVRFITGNGNYTDDISRPGQTHAFFIRSPHAHATIKNIDTAANVQFGHLGLGVAADSNIALILQSTAGANDALRVNSSTGASLLPAAPRCMPGMEGASSGEAIFVTEVCAPVSAGFS